MVDFSRYNNLASMFMAPVRSATGLAEVGNLDVNKRPIVQLEDGSIATVNSMSFNDGGMEVLVPRVGLDGSMMSEDQARDHYFRTGENLGKFYTPDEASTYADELHGYHDQIFSMRKPTHQWPPTNLPTLSDMLMKGRK